MKPTREDVEKLITLFAELNTVFFESTLPSIEVRFSGRLKTTGGQYFRRPKKLIQISTRYLAFENAWEEIRDTLGHEMVHFWLDHQGKPCGHTPEFRAKLSACGFNRYSRLAPVRMRYTYKCPKCEVSYHRRKRGIWSCGPCSGKRYNPIYRLVLVDETEAPKEKPSKEKADEMPCL